MMGKGKMQIEDQNDADILKMQRAKSSLNQSSAINLDLLSEQFQTTMHRSFFLSTTKEEDTTKATNNI